MRLSCSSPIQAIGGQLGYEVGIRAMSCITIPSIYSSSFPSSLPHIPRPGYTNKQPPEQITSMHHPPHQTDQQTYPTYFAGV